MPNGFDFDAFVKEIGGLLKSLSQPPQSDGRAVINRLLGNTTNVQNNVQNTVQNPLFQPNQEDWEDLGKMNEQQFRELIQMKEGEGWMQTGMSKTQKNWGHDKAGNPVMEDFMSYEFKTPQGQKTWLARGLESSSVLRMSLLPSIKAKFL